MKAAGRPARYVFGVWGGFAAASGVAAGAGLSAAGASPSVVAAITAVAAGAILPMLADTMIPEAFEQANLVSGLVTALGFLTAFAIDRGGGQTGREARRRREARAEPPAHERIRVPPATGRSSDRRERHLPFQGAVSEV